MKTRLHHLWLVGSVGMRLASARRRRALFREMRAFSSRLPRLLERPLADVMRELDGFDAQCPCIDVSERDIRRIADLTAVLDRRSPLGLCLRRSLTRYHFLRRHDVPVSVQFGATRSQSTPTDEEIRGHAWVTLAGKPYFERDDHWQEFSVMLTWPPDAGASAAERA